MEPLLLWVHGDGGELLVYPPAENTKKRKACSQNDTIYDSGGGTSQDPHHIDIDIMTVTDGWNGLTKSRSVNITPIQLKKPQSLKPPETTSIDYPRCMEWLPFQSGNSIALGIKKSIQICNLMTQEDDYDCHEKKKFLFGGTRFINTMKENVVACKEYTRTGSHDGPVLDLSINHERGLLASSSTDCVVKLWNLETSKRVLDIKQHVSEVSAVSWDRRGHNLLLSGSMDKTIYMMDLREDIKNRAEAINWETTSGVKSLAWNPLVDHKFMAHLVNGEVLFYDARNLSIENSIQDFDNEADKISAIAYNPLKKDVFAMGSSAGKFKVWDQNCVSHKHLKAQQLCQEKISRLTFRTNDALLAYASSSNDVGIIRDES